MGGRGKKEGGAAKGFGAVKTLTGETQVEQVARQLGFKNADEARQATQFYNTMKDAFDKAGIDTTTGLGKKLLEDLTGKKLSIKELQDIVKKNPKLAGAAAVHYVVHHGGHSGLGPIMLRIGLPRDKFKDVLDILKPLRDHALLNLEMPVKFKGFENPLSVPGHAAATPDTSNPQHPLSFIDWLSQMKIRTYVTDIWLKRIAYVPTSIRSLFQ